MNPEHKNPKEFRTDTRGNPYWARAPYNFVPLPEKVVTVDSVNPQDSYTGHTGWIDCTLTTKSPLYTRSAMSIQFFKADGEKAFHELSPGQKDERARFFSIQNVESPVIPSSSLRGMVRALVEIAGYGKVQPVTKMPLIFRAVGDRTSLGEFYRNRLMDEGQRNYFTPKMQAGYIEKRGTRWSIQPAQEIGGVTFARILIDDLAKIPHDLKQWGDCKNSRIIWVKLGKYDYQPVRHLHVKYTPALEPRASPADGFQQCVLAFSGKMKEKKHEAVIYPKGDPANRIEIEDELVQAYRDQISPEQETLLGKDGVLRHDQPVFFLMDKGKLVFFSHTMMMRLPYREDHSPFHFVPPGLRDEKIVDLAESIFGFVPQGKTDKRTAHAGRVFITDATTEASGDQVWLASQPITPKILATPKPTTFQHYLTQQQPDAVATGQKNKDGTLKMELKLDHYASPPPHQTVIRGHKLYWHKGDISLGDIQETDAAKIENAKKQYTRIKPVKSGVAFQFRIYFENLERAELGALLWVLQLPPEHDHKLGMGKPLGMGAVEINATLHLNRRSTRYQKLFQEEKWFYGDPDNQAEQDLKAAFEKFVLDRMDQTERGNAQHLGDLERIKLLLKMLEWKGPDKGLTRYMTIQPNEFKERPVLPDPLNLAEPTISQKQPDHQASSAPAESTAPHTPSVKHYTVGAVFTGKISDVYDDGSIDVEVPGVDPRKGYAMIPATVLGGRKYHEGNPARCEIIRIYTDTDGRTVYECKPGPKPPKKGESA